MITTIISIVFVGRLVNITFDMLSISQIRITSINEALEVYDCFSKWLVHVYLKMLEIANKDCLVIRLFS